MAMSESERSKVNEITRSFFHSNSNKTLQAHFHFVNSFKLFLSRIQERREKDYFAYIKEALQSFQKAIDTLVFLKFCVDEVEINSIHQSSK